MTPETPETPRWTAVQRPDGAWAIACCGRVLSLQTSEQAARELVRRLNAADERAVRSTAQSAQPAKVGKRLPKVKRP